MGMLAGVVLLRGRGRAFGVGWMVGSGVGLGARFGAAALVLGPVVLLAKGRWCGPGTTTSFPAQLAAMVSDPETLMISYSLYTAGLVLMIPAFLALTAQFGRERPGWAFWGATMAVVGSAVRIFQEGISFLALQLVFGVQGLDAATMAVGDTYGAWYVLLPLNGCDNLAWGMLAIGAYRAGVLGWVQSLGLAFMITHYGGVLKGTDLNSLTAAVLLVVALVPVGVRLWRGADPVPRRASHGSHIAAAVFLAAQYVFAVLSNFRNLG